MTYHCYLCHQSNLQSITNTPWPLYKCLTCGLVQIFPRLTVQTVTAMYQGDYWKNYSFYTSQLAAHHQYFQQKIIDIKKYQTKGRLLDLGCAVGVFLAVAQQNGYQAEGVDVSEYAVNECRRRHLTATVGTINSIKKNNHYEVICAFELIEHEFDPLATIKKTYCLLKDRGLLVITVPDSHSWTAKLMGKYWFGYKNKEHLFHFTKNSLSQLLKTGGYQTIYIGKDISRHYLLLYYFERINYYLFRSSIITKLISRLKTIPVINRLTVPLNPWGNLIAYAQKG